jgi:hypothetical protein
VPSPSGWTNVFTHDVGTRARKRVKGVRSELPQN